MTVIDVARDASMHKSAAPKLIGDFLRLHAERKPDQTAFICGGETISWAALDLSSTRLAGWLLGQGLKTGDAVALCSLNSLALVQIFLAVLKAGLIAVPINTRLKAEEIGYILKHADARMAFCEPAFAPALAEAGADFPVFSHLPALAGAPQLPPLRPDMPALIAYTSGTTARPKGVLHSQGSYCQKGVKGWGIFPHVANKFGLCALPMMHVSGLWCLAMAITEGYPLVWMPRFEAGAALEQIEKFGCTMMGALPTMLLAMVEEQAMRPRRIETLCSVVGGGDAVSPALQKRAEEILGCPVLELYAMTEMCAIAINPAGAARVGSVGVPLDGIELRILGADGRDVGLGETGEIAVRSSSLCMGYWKDPELTRAAMGDGWLRSGDLGARDGDGFIWFKGRKKEVIIRAGSNISPQEVEDALYKHPAVLEAGVIGVSDPVTIERVAAFVVLRDGHNASAEELCAFARRHIADYKVPEEIHFRDLLPKNPVGKVQRRALKEMLAP